MRMADLPYSGVTSFMIKTLLDKKYALPYRTVDALVDHFMGFHKEDRSLPVIWHLSLLTFVQRYKQEIRAEVHPTPLFNSQLSCTWQCLNSSLVTHDAWEVPVMLVVQTSSLSALKVCLALTR